MPSKKPQQPEPGFEAAMAELEAILERMGDDETPLDEAVELYAKAAELIKTCDKRLKSAKVRVEEISAGLGEAMAVEDPDGV